MRLPAVAPARCLVGLLIVLTPAFLTAQSAPPAAAGKPAEQVYKNIQVLKGVPADQIVPAMQFITASLGVQCDFCHLENAFEKDDKETKQTARKMMRMMFAINKENFDGHREVTCYACHRGAHKPVATPVLSDDDLKLSQEHHMEHDAGPTSSLPTADSIISHYMETIGGAEAAAKISTRIQKGTISVGSEHFPVDIVSKAPTTRVTTVHFPGGDSVTGINADEGWLSSPGKSPHLMSATEAKAARMDAGLFFPARLKELFKEFHVQQEAKLQGADVYVISASTSESPDTELFFDQHSGLLLRVLRFSETPLGLNPTEIDYGDYREADGVKTPFQWSIKRPSGRFTIEIEKLQQNASIASESFLRAPAETH